MDDQPTLDKIAFRTLALRVLQQQFPHVAVELLDDPERVRCTGFAEDTQIEVYLGNLRRRYSRFAIDDQEKETLLRDFWSHMVMPSVDETSFSWAEAQHRLRLQIVQPTSLIHPTRGDTTPSFVTRPLVTCPSEANLLQVLALDLPRTIKYLSGAQQQQWGIPEKQLWAIALRNLAHATQPGDVETWSRGGYTIYSPRWTDGYAAARLLLPTVQTQARTWAGGDAYIAIPNRDRLLVWSSRYPAEIQRMAMEIVTNMHEQEDYPLSTGVFLIRRVPVRTFGFVSGDSFN